MTSALSTPTPCQSHFLYHVISQGGPTSVTRNVSHPHLSLTRPSLNPLFICFSFSGVMCHLLTPLLYQVCTHWVALATILFTCCLESPSMVESSIVPMPWTLHPGTIQQPIQVLWFLYLWCSGDEGGGGNQETMKMNTKHVQYASLGWVRRIYQQFFYLSLLSSFPFLLVAILKFYCLL